jgi:hypothetical protein
MRFNIVQSEHAGRTGAESGEESTPADSPMRYGFIT